MYVKNHSVVGGDLMDAGGTYWTNHDSGGSRNRLNLCPEPLTDEQRAEIARVRAKLDPGPDESLARE